MRVLQTIGHRIGFPPTPFYYRRDQIGVRIESIVGKSIRFHVENSKWERLLTECAAFPDQTLGISSRINDDARSIHELIETYAEPTSERDKAYITAVLFHEGSIILHHGPEGNGQLHRIAVRISTQIDIRYAHVHPDI